jgi:hypothetical protein
MGFLRGILSDAVVLALVFAQAAAISAKELYCIQSLFANMGF